MRSDKRVRSQRDRSQLLRDLKAAFPQITAQLNAEHGQLHFEVEAADGALLVLVLYMAGFVLLASIT